MAPEERAEAIWLVADLGRRLRRGKVIDFTPYMASCASAIETVLTALEEAKGREHRVCAGCGSSRSMAELTAGGHVSCCPERKMLTAKEWAARAEKAEQQAAVYREYYEANDDVRRVGRLNSTEAQDDRLALAAAAVAALSPVTQEGK